jgi:hypothetical protein
MNRQNAAEPDGTELCSVELLRVGWKPAQPEEPGLNDDLIEETPISPAPDDFVRKDDPDLTKTAEDCFRAEARSQTERENLKMEQRLFVDDKKMSMTNVDNLIEADADQNQDTNVSPMKCYSMMALVFIFLTAISVSAYSYLVGWPWPVSSGTRIERPPPGVAIDRPPPDDAYGQSINLLKKKKMNTHTHNFTCTIPKYNITMEGNATTTFFNISDDHKRALIDFNFRYTINTTHPGVNRNGIVQVKPEAVSAACMAEIDDTGNTLAFQCPNSLNDFQGQLAHDLFEQTAPYLQHSRKRNGEGTTSMGFSWLKHDNELKNEKLKITRRGELVDSAVSRIVDEEYLWDLQSDTIAVAKSSVTLRMPDGTNVDTELTTRLAKKPHYKPGSEDKRQQWEALRAEKKVRDVSVRKPKETDPMDEVYESKNRSATSWENQRGRIDIRTDKNVTRADLEKRSQDAKVKGKISYPPVEDLLSLQIIETENKTFTDVGSRRLSYCDDIFPKAFAAKHCLSEAKKLNLQRGIGLCSFLKSWSGLEDSRPIAEKFAKKIGTIGHQGKQDDALRHVHFHVSCPFALFNERGIMKKTGIFYPRLEYAVRDCQWAGELYEVKGEHDNCGNNKPWDSFMDRWNNKAGGEIALSEIGVSTVQYDKDIKLVLLRLRLSWDEVHVDWSEIEKRIYLATLNSKDFPTCADGRAKTVAMQRDSRHWNLIAAEEHPKGFPYDMKTPVIHYESYVDLKPCDGLIKGTDFDRFNQANWYLLHLKPGASYRIETSDLSPNCDTVMLLLDLDFHKLQVNDDCDGTHRSCISFTAGQNEEQMYARVNDYNGWSDSIGPSGSAPCHQAAR